MAAELELALLRATLAEGFLQIARKRMLLAIEAIRANDPAEAGRHLAIALLATEALPKVQLDEHDLGGMPTDHHEPGDPP